MYWYQSPARETKKTRIIALTCGYLAATTFSAALLFGNFPSPSINGGPSVAEIPEEDIEDIINPQYPDPAEPPPADPEESTDEWWEDYVNEDVNNNGINDLLEEWFDPFGYNENSSDWDDDGTGDYPGDYSYYDSEPIHGGSSGDPNYDDDDDDYDDYFP